MKPALTAEEWRDGRTANGSTCIQFDGESVLLSPSPPDGDMRMVVNRPEALAAFCLHEQPFGFKREEPAEEREIAGILEDLVEMLPDDKGKRILARAWLCRKRADRIEALLAPVE